MARTARSLVADQIRIEDEVWEEAFASRVRSRPSRTQQSSRPARVQQSSRPARPHLTAVPAETDRPLVALPAESAEPEPLAYEPPTRRTVYIQGRGAERNLPISSPRPRRRHESAYFQPDRLAMWAVLMGFLLVIAAMASAHL